MTGLTETDRIVEGLEAGGVDYVTKPIVIDELLARIRVHLGNARLSKAHAQRSIRRDGSLFATDAQAAAFSGPRRRQAGFSTPLLPDFDDRTFTFPDPLAKWLAARSDGVTDQPSDRVCRSDPNARSTYRSSDAWTATRSLLRVAEENESGEAGVLRQKLGLSRARSGGRCFGSRVASRTATSAKILGMSPRTVNKHLEQIYVKLGVENRAAAAAIAVRHLS